MRLILAFFLSICVVSHAQERNHLQHRIKKSPFSETGQNENMTFSISGNAGIPGALVVLLGAANASVTADSSGNYTFSGLSAGQYYVTCQLTGTKFSPWTSAQTVASADITGVTFSAVPADTVTRTWKKQGVVLAPNATQLNNGNPVSGVLEPSVIFEGNAQILSGSVYKMWFTGGANNTAKSSINYAESLDGKIWTQYSSNPVINSHSAGRVFKNGATYYGYFQNGVGDSGGPLDQYTSSDGINWTLANSSVLTAGTSGAWDHTGIWNFTVVEIKNGTWYALYNSQPRLGDGWYTGLATSSDGVTWSKNASNPVLANFVNPNVLKVGSTYYAWGDITVFGQGGTTPYSFPTVFARASSTDLISWTNPTPSLQPSDSWEGVDGNSQLDSPALLDTPNGVYMWYAAGPTAAAGTSFQIGLATTALSAANLVTLSSEGATMAPIRKQYTSAAFVSQTDTAATYTFPVTTGDMLLAAFAYAGQSEAATISDTQGNIWTAVFDRFNTAAGVATIYLWTAIAKATGSTTVTAHLNVAQVAGMLLAEYQNVNALDQHDSQTLAASTTIATPTVTTTIASSMGVAIFYTAGGNVSASPTNGYIEQLVTGGAFALGDNILSSAAATSSSVTGTSGTVAALIANFYLSQSSIGGWTNRQHRFVNKRG